ncbi:RDD family protein [Mycoplasma sp. Ms02]|uniref:RDD family protein n=1 Tax=Mycoplasma sp. Ms02 TaxID=353851 RepID=UPI001C8A92EE|nr:RDD family protein [Mycoplasma sp. Ms02]QZE12372.1 RDD family protein [Mycoplasma sp. Ms02]
MFYYKNINFWFKILSFLTDTIILLITAILTYIVYIQFEKTKLTFILNGITISLELIFYLVIIPYLLKGKTIGMLITKTKWILIDKTQPSLFNYLKRNSLNLFVIILAILLMISFFSWSDSEFFEKNISYTNVEKFSVFQKISISLIQVLFSSWTFIHFANFVLFLFSKKKENFLETINGMRHVYDKQVFIESKQQPKRKELTMKPRPIIRIKEEN